jgi:hypothetical protein
MRLRALVVAAGLLWPVPADTQAAVSYLETGNMLYADCSTSMQLKSRGGPPGITSFHFDGRSGAHICRYFRSRVNVTSLRGSTRPAATAPVALLDRQQCAAPRRGLLACWR